MDLFIFHRSPETLDEDVGAPGVSAVHADLDAGADTQSGELPAGELRTWCVLAMSGLPWRAIASSTVSMQNATSMVIENARPEPGV